MHQDASKDAPRREGGGETRALLALGLPLVGSHLAQMAIGVTDMLMMGWYDLVSLAALSLAGPIFFIFFIMGSGFAWAVMPMVATAAGTANDRQVRRVTRMGLWLSLAFGVLVTPVLVYSEVGLEWMGQDPEVARLAGLYLALSAMSMIPALLVMVLKSYFSALERTRVILVVTLIAASLNVALNYALIFGNWGAPELGVAGAAIASAIGHALSFIGLAVYAVWKTPEYALFKNFHRPDTEAIASVFRLGWPIGLTSLAEVGLFAASSVMMGWVGTIALAAHGIALQIASVTFMIHVGLSQAITVRVGRHRGQGDQQALRTASLTAMALSLGAACLTMLAFLTIPELLVGVFVDPTDPDRGAILAVGATLLAVAALFQLVDSGQVMALGMLRGVQDTRVPMIMAIISYWLIGLPVSYVLGFTAGLGGVGIWLGLSVGLAGAGIMMQARFWRRYARV
jgi:MATE family, multidrug efflux pump